MTEIVGSGIWSWCLTPRIADVKVAYFERLATVCGVYVLMWYLRPLDWLNFFLADVRGGLGPYVGVFLLTQAD